MRTPPRSGASTPAIIFSSVVLPAPFRPMTDQRSPRRIVRSTPSWITRRPYAFDTSSSTATCSPDRAGCRNSKSTTFRSLRQLDLLDLVERLDPALHLRRLRGVRREPIDEALFLGQHRLLTRVGRLAVRFADAPLPLVEIVVARVERDLARVDLGDAVDDPVHEVPVVRRHQERARQRLEEGLEPDDRFDVEVVRRLVEEEDVGTAEQHARHGDAHLPAAGERTHVAVDPLVVEPEAMEDFARLTLERIAAEMLVLLLDFAKARQDAIHVVGARGIGHRLVQRFELVVQRAHAPAAGDGFVEHASARHLLDVLAEVADRQPLRHRHVPLVRASPRR